jgi:hypothetical protein
MVYKISEKQITTVQIIKNAANAKVIIAPSKNEIVAVFFIPRLNASGRSSTSITYTIAPAENAKAHGIIALKELRNKYPNIAATVSTTPENMPKPTAFVLLMP